MARPRTDLLDNRSLAILLETYKGLIYWTLVFGQPLRGPHHREYAHVYQNEWEVKCQFLILILTIIMIQTHAEALLRHIASRCVGAPWVGLSRAGGGCGPREPVCVSLSWVHATGVTQNSPHHRRSRFCISKRSKIVVER